MKCVAYARHRHHRSSLFRIQISRFKTFIQYLSISEHVTHYVMPEMTKVTFELQKARSDKTVVGGANAIKWYTNIIFDWYLI